MADSEAKQRKVSPGIGGAFSDAIDAVKSYMGAGRRETSGNKNEQEQLDELDNSHSSNQSSNAGRAAQSTDHQNQY